jgi:hypothetical protein
MVPDQRHRQMDAARVLADLTTEALWFRYVALTGTGDLIDLDGYLHGLTSLESSQQVVLAQALNEALDDGHGAHRFPMAPPVLAAGSAWPELCS